MGCGKSSVGAAIARKLSRVLLDCDTLIEQTESLQIAEIFAQYGEAEFRKKESALAQWIAQNVRNAVVATGGGLPIFYPNIQNLGIVIYLKTDFDTIVARLNQDERAKRPLFATQQKAQELYMQRAQIYEKCANWTIDSQKSAQEVADFAIALLRSKGLKL